MQNWSHPKRGKILKPGKEQQRCVLQQEEAAAAAVGLEASEVEGNAMAMKVVRQRKRSTDFEDAVRVCVCAASLKGVNL